MLLYAQPITRIVRLTLDDLTHQDGELHLRLGNPSTPVPEPFAALLLKLADARPTSTPRPTPALGGCSPAAARVGPPTPAASTSTYAAQASPPAPPGQQPFASSSSRPRPPSSPTPSATTTSPPHELPPTQSEPGTPTPPTTTPSDHLRDRRFEYRSLDQRLLPAKLQTLTICDPGHVQRYFDPRRSTQADALSRADNRNNNSLSTQIVSVRAGKHRWTDDASMNRLSPIRIDHVILVHVSPWRANVRLPPEPSADNPLSSTSETTVGYGRARPPKH
jgi:hypothetical protein